MTDKKQTLIELSSLSNQIEQAIQDNNGEIGLELEALMDRVGEQMATKVDQVDHAFDMLDAMAAIWKKRKDEAARIQKSYETAYERLQGLVKASAQVMGVDEIKGVTRRFKISKSTRMEIIDDQLDVRYKDCEMIFKPNRERVKEALTAGKEIVGAKLVETTSVRRYANKG